MWETTEGILASGHRLAVVTTGGGSQTVHYLLNHPGASRAVLEVQIPYCQRALVDYLAAIGPHPVTADTARAMAASTPPPMEETKNGMLPSMLTNWALNSASLVA